MADGSSLKLKIVYLMKILLEETDEEHKLTLKEIESALEAYGIRAERKSLYNDMESLKNYGLDIIRVQENRHFFYYVGSRDFELAELKLLVDAVQSAKFITEKKSNELIKKIGGLASRHEADKLQRQVYMAQRPKTNNESIYYNVDTIHMAIGENMKIKFQYFNWNVKKQMELRKDGAYYEVSPWALVWDDENYYLVAYDDADNCMKHFRVDKMLNIDITTTRRTGRNLFNELDMSVYTRKMFGMYDAKETNVTIRCKNSMAGVMIDRFGKQVTIIPVDAEHFNVIVKVAASQNFIHWVLMLGDDVQITAPESVVDMVREEIDRLSNIYKK